MSHDNPYASPSTSSNRAVIDGIVARLAFWRVYRVALITTLFAAIPILIVGFRYDVVDFRLLIPATIIAVLLQAIVIRLQTVRMSPDLLRCADFWGRYRLIQVSEITKVEVTGWRPFRFLRIRSNDSKTAIWLPLFLDHQQDLWEYILNNLASSNPLHEMASKLRESNA